MKEIWKDIPGYGGIYRASTYGKIRSIDRVVKRKSSTLQNVKVNGKVLNPIIHPAGYYRTPIRINGKTKYVYVHNLIALTFIGEKPYRYDVDHIDHNRKNNNIDNLRYLSYKDNRGMLGNKHATKNK